MIRHERARNAKGRLASDLLQAFLVLDFPLLTSWKRPRLAGVLLVMDSGKSRAVSVSNSLMAGIYQESVEVPLRHHGIETLPFLPNKEAETFFVPCIPSFFVAFSWIVLSDLGITHIVSVPNLVPAQNTAFQQK